MRFIAGVLGGLTGIYMLLIVARVLITWFSRGDYGRPSEILRRITDPYLDWFRRFPVFRTPRLDLSPIAAMAVLSLVNRIFLILADYGRISLGIILALLLQAVWSAASFLLIFFIIALVLRLVSLRFRLGGGFWNIVDAVSRPVLYRIERLVFRRRLVDYRLGIAVSLALLGGAWLILDGLVKLVLLPLLTRLPF
jgi:YggT family protein